MTHKKKVDQSSTKPPITPKNTQIASQPLKPVEGVTPLSNEAKGQEIFNLSDTKLDPNKKQAVDLFEAQPKTIKAAKEMGIDVNGYTHQVDKSALNHAINKHSGDTLPVTKEDFKLIPDILKNPDNVKPSLEKTNQGLDALIYTKRYNGTTYYIEEVRTGQGKTLNMTTLYKTKTPVDTGVAEINQRTLTSAPQSGTPTSSGNSNLPQNTGLVNTQPLKPVEGVKGGVEAVEGVKKRT